MRMKAGMLAVGLLASVLSLGASATADETSTTIGSSTTNAGTTSTTAGTTSTTAGATSTTAGTTSTTAATTTTVLCLPPTTAALPTTTADAATTTVTIADCPAPSTDPTSSVADSAPAPTTTSGPAATLGPVNPGGAPPVRGTQVPTRDIPPAPTTTTTTTTTTTLPAPTWGLPWNSGTGRRVVYSKSAQRVWVVDSAGRMIKTHLVSGRQTPLDPRPGTYSVWSRSRYTFSISNPSIRWGYMVRFAWGARGGNIGFHEIPYQYGVPVQSIWQLGQPLSGGCVRQAKPDAIWMWNWAQLGTKVVVLG